MSASDSDKQSCPAAAARWCRSTLRCLSPSSDCEPAVAGTSAAARARSGQVEYEFRCHRRSRYMLSDQRRYQRLTQAIRVMDSTSHGDHVVKAESTCAPSQFPPASHFVKVQAATSSQQSLPKQPAQTSSNSKLACLLTWVVAGGPRTQVRATEKSKPQGDCATCNIAPVSPCLRGNAGCAKRTAVHRPIKYGLDCT